MWMSGSVCIVSEWCEREHERQGLVERHGERERNRHSKKFFGHFHEISSILKSNHTRLSFQVHVSRTKNVSNAVIVASMRSMEIWQVIAEEPHHGFPPNLARQLFMHVWVAGVSFQSNVTVLSWDWRRAILMTEIIVLICVWRKLNYCPIHNTAVKTLYIKKKKAIWNRQITKK